MLSESGLGFTTDLVLLTHLNLDGELLAPQWQQDASHAIRFPLGFYERA